MPLDRTNLHLLQRLQDDARLTVAALARNLGKSETAVRQRIHRLEARGHLTDYHAAVDAQKAGFRAKALVRAQVTLGDLARVRQGLAANPCVTGACLTTGAKPLVAQVVGRDISHLLHELGGGLGSLPLREMETETILETLVAPRPPALLKVAAAPPPHAPEVSAAARLLQRRNPPRAGAASRRNPREEDLAPPR